MAKLDDLVKRIERLEAESEIRKIVDDYCLKQDKRQLDAFLSIMTDDFCLTFPGWNLNLQGKENIKKFYEDVIYPGNEYNLHQVTNLDIKVNGSKAEAESYHILHIKTVKGDLQEAYGRYQFQFRKEGGRWKLARVDTFATLWEGTQAPQDPAAYERFPWPPKK